MSLKWLSSGSGAVVVSILLVWWSEGIKPPFCWQWGSLVNMEGVLHIRVEDAGSLKNLTWRGTYPLHCPLIVLQTMTGFHEQLCLSLGPLSDGIYRQLHHSLSQMYMICPTFMPTSCSHNLHPSLVDALVDIHGRSCNFPLIHPREVLLAGHWVTTQPLFSCGVILPSLPLGVDSHGLGLVHLYHAWWTPTHKGTPTSYAVRRSWFWWRMCDHPCWSITS